jgi:hypothetical protein
MKSPEDMLGAVSRSMKERTGKTLEEWVAAVQASGIDPLDQKAVRNWLKSEHGVKQNSPWAIADAAARAAGWQAPTVAEYVDNQYAGPKQALRPIFDKLAEAALALGDDVSMEGRGGYTPFVRKRQFAAVEAPSRRHVDLGLRYMSAPESARLAPAKAPGQSTHKVRLESVDEVDDEVLHLLAAAYDQNG